MGRGGGAKWLDPLLLPPSCVAFRCSSGSPGRRRTSLCHGRHCCRRWLPDVSGALAAPGGCRVVLELPPLSTARATTLWRQGFSLVRGASDGPAAVAAMARRLHVCPVGVSQWWHAGRVPVTAPHFQLDLDAAEAAMDRVGWRLPPQFRSGYRVLHKPRYRTELGVCLFIRRAVGTCVIRDFVLRAILRSLLSPPAYHPPTLQSRCCLER